MKWDCESCGTEFEYDEENHCVQCGGAFCKKCLTKDEDGNLICKVCKKELAEA